MAPRKTKQKKNHKMDRLEAFIADFDSEVETILERMHEKVKCLLKDSDNAYNMALIKFSKAERQMNWLENCKIGAEKPMEDVKVGAEKPMEETKVGAEKPMDNIKMEVESVMAEVHTIPPKSAKKRSKKQGDGGDGSEADENTVQTTGKKGKARRPPTTSKRARATQNTSVRKSNRKPLVTPARSAPDRPMTTPLITPRFDPRLPKTPAVRGPRHRERVYSISANGSPIAEHGGSSDIVINVPVGNGESIQLLASQMDSMDLSQLDEAALRGMRLLQNRLTTLCGISE